LSNAIGGPSPGVSSRRPKSWSMNWPQTQPHCDTACSEKTFWPMSLKRDCSGSGAADRA
jgi:hypothetical protein